MKEPKNQRGQDQPSAGLVQKDKALAFVNGTTQQELQEVSCTFRWDFLSHFNLLGHHRLLNENSCSWLRQRRYLNTLRVSVAQRSPPALEACRPQQQQTRPYCLLDNTLVMMERHFKSDNNARNPDTSGSRAEE